MRKFVFALATLAVAGLASADEAVVSNAKLDTSVAPVTQAALADGWYRMMQGSNMIGFAVVTGGIVTFTALTGGVANGVQIPGGDPVADLPSHYGACFTVGC
jgi:hypothetical protein